jgi:hypothetical protein
MNRRRLRLEEPLLYIVRVFTGMDLRKIVTLILISV